MKAKQQLDPILVDLKNSVLGKFVENLLKFFCKGDMGYLDIKVGFVFRM